MGLPRNETSAPIPYQLTECGMSDSGKKKILFVITKSNCRGEKAMVLLFHETNAPVPVYSQKTI